MSDLDELRAFANSPDPAPAQNTPAPAKSSDLDLLHSFVAPELQQEKFGTTGQQAIAGLEGIARGATLGGSDVLERAVGVNPENIKGRMQANPITSTGGAMLGGAGLIAATGGIAAPEEAGILGTSLATGAEGAVFGAGNAITDAALGDPNLNAQKILSDIGMGAALGVGAGALGYGLKSAFGKFGAKGSVAEKIGQEAEGANNATRVAQVVSESNGLKANAPEVLKAADELNLPVMNGMVSSDPWVQKAEDALMSGAPTYSAVKRANLYAEGHNGVVDALEKVAPESQLSKADVGSVIQNNLTNQIAEENQPISALYNAIKETTQEIPLSEKSAPAISRNILGMDEVRISPSSPEAKLASRVADEISNLKTVDDVKAYRSILNRSISPTAPAGEKRIAAILSDKLQNWEESSIERYAGKQNEIFNGLEDPGQIEAMRPHIENFNSLLEQKKAANELYKPFIEKVGTLAEKLGKKRVYGPQDAINFIQDLTPEQITQKLFSKNDSGFLNFFEDKFPQEMALLREYQKNAIREAATKSGTFEPRAFFREVNKLEPEVQKAIFFPDELSKIKAAETYYNSFPKNFNPSGTSGMSAFREFFHSPTGALMANARDFAIEGYIKTMGALPENLRPNPIEVGGELAEKFNKFSAARKIANRTTNQISSNVKALLGGGGAVAGIAAGAAHSYDQKVDRIKELAENPEALQAHIQNHIEGISKTLPGVSQSIATSLATSVNFLNSKIPRPNNQLPFSPKFEPSAAQKQKFDRYYDAVSNPVGAMKSIKQGNLTLDEMESLAVTHPDLLKHMQDQINQAMSPDIAKKIPYHTRQALSLFLGKPLDTGDLPSVKIANQASFVLAPAGHSQPSKKQKSTLGGLKELKVSNRSATETSKSEQSPD